MFYLRAFLKSLYDLNWLKKQNNDLKKSTNYFIFFILFLAFSYSSYTTFISVPRVKKELEEGLKNIPDINLEIKDEKIFISGIEEPFQTTIKNNDDSGDIFIYIDTKDVNVDYLNYSKSVENEDRLIITSSSISFFTRDGMGKSYSAANLLELKVNKEKILSFFDNQNSIFIFTLIVFFVFFVFQRLLSLLFVSFVFYLSLKRKKGLNYKFKNVLITGFFAITAPSVIVSVLLAFGVTIPFLYIFLLFLVMYLVFGQKDVSPVKIEKVDEVLEDLSEELAIEEKKEDK